jgi:3-hydroxybenzoate 6-monooxygenase
LAGASFTRFASTAMAIYLGGKANRRRNNHDSDERRGAHSGVGRRHRGLTAAYTLARQGIPIRVFEQSSEFREVGAGIQLGSNIFRLLDKIGLKDAILVDAHRPPAQEMRDALTGKLIIRIPLGDAFFKRFGEPYGVTHRADIHGTFLRPARIQN